MRINSKNKNPGSRLGNPNRNKNKCYYYYLFECAILHPCFRLIVSVLEILDIAVGFYDYLKFYTRPVDNARKTTLFSPATPRPPPTAGGYTDFRNIRPTNNCRFPFTETVRCWKFAIPLTTYCRRVKWELINSNEIKNTNIFRWCSVSDYIDLILKIKKQNVYHGKKIANMWDV